MRGYMRGLMVGQRVLLGGIDYKVMWISRRDGRALVLTSNPYAPLGVNVIVRRRDAIKAAIASRRASSTGEG